MAEDFAWTIDNGVLTISGHGRMPDYDVYGAPWLDRNEDIKEVIIESGITSIGNYALYDCRNLVNATTPKSVINIGANAFQVCDSLTSTLLNLNLAYKKTLCYNNPKSNEGGIICHRSNM